MLTAVRLRDERSANSPPFYIVFLAVSVLESLQNSYGEHGRDAKLLQRHVQLPDLSSRQ